MKKNIRRTLVILTAIAGLSLLSACEKKKQDEPEVDMAPFTPPTDFKWEGNYLDSVNELAVLTVELDGTGYNCYINSPDPGITHIDSYSFHAVPAEDGLGLSYTAGTHTVYELPSGDNADAGVTTTEIYSDGTGRIYYLDGEVFWLDEKDNNGSGFIFERVDDEAAVSETVTE